MTQRLLRVKPYTITAQGNGGSLKVVLSPLCELKDGDKVYEILRDDGVIEIIPSKVYLERSLHLETIEKPMRDEYTNPKPERRVKSTKKDLTK